MEQHIFIERFHVLLPGCPPEAVQPWCDFAAECVEQRQYVNFKAAEIRAASVAEWLDVLYEGLRQTKETFGPELATRVAALGLDHCCLYPGEMPKAAECLLAGDGVADILAKVESGEIDCENLFSAGAPTYIDVDSGNCAVKMDPLWEKLRDERETGPPVTLKHPRRKRFPKHRNQPDR